MGAELREQTGGAELRERTNGGGAERMELWGGAKRTDWWGGAERTELLGAELREWTGGGGALRAVLSRCSSVGGAVKVVRSRAWTGRSQRSGPDSQLLQRPSIQAADWFRTSKLTLKPGGEEQNWNRTGTEPVQQ